MSDQNILHQICKEEKKKAQELSQSAESSKDRYNACQAINAWDEVLGQLYKPKKTTYKRLEKAISVALRVVSLMVEGEYKKETIEKINSLKVQGGIK